MNRVDFSEAKCVGFGVMTSPMSWKEASFFLQLCASCPLRQECIDVVNPMSNWFDGITGGYLFENGKPLAEKFLKIPLEERPFADEANLKRYIQKRKLKG